MPTPITEQVKRTWPRRRHDHSAGGVAYRRASADSVRPPSLTVEALTEPTEPRASATGTEPRASATGAGSDFRGELEIALIATRSGTRWQLPKGTCESGENAEQTALREVAEEVGLQTACEGFLQTIEYWYWDTYRKETPELVRKQVDFFLLRVTGGELSDASIEVDGVAWFTAADALQVLTFPGEREVVQAALDRLSA